MNTLHDFEAAITKIQDLHPTAAVFARAHVLIASPTAQLDDIADIVKLDTALTADVIRFSNSGAVGKSVPAEDLDTAIHRVGLKAVDQFLGLILSKSVLNQNLQCYGITAYDYWSSSVSTAFFMELLAVRLKENASKAYTLGILHAAGRLVINQVLEDLQVTTYWDGRGAIESWEMDSVGLTYSMAGALLLKGWGFPHDFCEIIEFQLLPERVKNPSMLLKMLNFSLRLLHTTGFSFSIKDWDYPESDLFLKECGISLAEIKSMVQIAKQKHAQAQASLGIQRPS